ncbi:DUF3427 domain-containing protein [Lapidilactobacillus achengensis]|uniref:DUF3427 domain-containing protein n=1 Tax=Lapidilactobacillus achengensis TaxID=2486000 RepID=A0ABW1ULA3_9LACO|nr:DEAD/DEAH box helicase [Lapidilactobacillus achengensis]
MEKGLYERLIDQRLATILQTLTDDVTRAKVDDSELPFYLADQLKRLALAHFLDEKTAEQIPDFNRLVELLRADGSLSTTKDEELLLTEIRAQKTAAQIVPETKLVEPTLFTGRSSKNFPSLASEFNKEIRSSNEIDLIVSFIKVGGINTIYESLKTFTENGGQLRILTTTYMGASDAKAIQRLAQLPNTQVKVSYDTKAIRLHAKTYIFQRATGFSTAYIGSSNISNAALTSGREWNVKVTNARLPELYKQLISEFDLFWNSSDFERYDPQQDFPRLDQELGTAQLTPGTALPLAYFDIKPYPYQQKILDELSNKRKNGVNRNLVVMATGTGKTIVAALDFKRFFRDNPQAKLLFIAHTVEITQQALATFRQVLQDQNFGSLLDGINKPASLTHVFATIQTFRKLVADFPADYYHYIIIDEAHHTGAPTYWQTLDQLQPQILLGLTATPDRMDGFDILGHFDQQISAELNLFDAIEQEYLAPFQYFGISDSVDLAQIEFHAGDYDLPALSQALSNENRLNTIFAALERYGLATNQIKAIGFCVDQDHAKYMAAKFTERGIPATYLISAESERRAEVRRALQSGQVNFVFTVNMYNEGVDFPEVNTVLFLRPTQSKTIFLQQLGRGLRRAEGKDFLTVLDFIGGQNKKYNFQTKFKALIRKGTVRAAVENDFPYVPAGSVVQLERVAKETVLQNLRQQATGKKWFQNEVREFQDSYELAPTLANLVAKLDVTPTEIYTELLDKNTTLTDLRQGPQAQSANYAYAFKNLAPNNNKHVFKLLLKPDPARLSDQDYRYLYATFFSGIKKGTDKFVEVRQFLAQPNAALQAELQELITYKQQHDYLEDSVDEHGFVKYGTYTNAQIMAHLPGMERTFVNTSGVLNVKARNSEVLFVTLEKSEQDYSPLTMYQDFLINRHELHWEGPHNRGNKYAQELASRDAILLFIRKNKRSTNYYYLGAVQPGTITGANPIQTNFTVNEDIPGQIYQELV